MSTFTPIASVTLASAQSEVIFAGIPQTYTDLFISMTVKNTGSLNNGQIQFNGDTTASYSGNYMQAAGSVSGGRVTNTTTLYTPEISTTDWTTFSINIFNYTNTTTFKTTQIVGGTASDRSAMWVGTWRKTQAISSLRIATFGGNLATGTIINIYGIANAGITNVAKATGGDSVYTDGTYWYHTFLSSGTFTPTQALTADYLVVAGGGSGGANFGAGGGAGGLRCTVGATGGGGSLESALSLTAQAYTVTIGAGGAAQLTDNVLGNAGSNSVFATITSTGGGGGGGATIAGGSGGSGGGAGGGTSARSGGAGTSSQGYAGGSNGGGPDAGGAGGGGAGAVGSNTTGSATGGAGGAGVTTAISGTSTSYAGGGGGGNSGGASGGGGAGGGSAANGVAGTANRGGGGGGGGQYSGKGAAGGSGIVIVRYAV